MFILLTLLLLSGCEDLENKETKYTCPNDYTLENITCIKYEITNPLIAIKITGN